MVFLNCDVCNFNEFEADEEFVGIFAPGTSFATTSGEMCAMFGCPKCNTVKFVVDREYIQRRKDEYKEKMKGER